MAKTVLITGGARGIGAATAKIMAQAGYAVAINYASSEEAANVLAKQLCQDGHNAMAVRADVRDRGQVLGMFRAVRQRMGAVDTLICNAGIAQQKLFQDITGEDWDDMFDINVKGVYHCVQAALPDMLRMERGCIVTVSSMWGQVGASMESHYAASKAAVIALTQSLARELGPSGIRANCVSPGTILTDMTTPLGEETLIALADETPLGRNGTPMDVARAIAYLCSQDAAFITGQTLPVNGGYLI